MAKIKYRADFELTNSIPYPVLTDDVFYEYFVENWLL